MLLLSPALSASGADKWFSTSTNSVELVSNAPPKQALDTLGQVEQLRYAIGELIGNPELAFRPTLRLLVLKQGDADAGTLRPGRSRLTLPLAANTPISPAVFQLLAKQLLDHGTTRLPPDFADGLQSFLSTIEVHGAHIVWGAPPAKRTLNWARVDLLATQYAGKIRVILYNLQRGSAEDPAFRNAIGKSAAEFTKEAEAFLKAGQFTKTDAPSRSLNAQHDLKIKALDSEEGKLAVADLLDARSEASYKAMIEAKSHMAEAYDGLGQLALLHEDRAGALENFSRAVELDSKDASLWVAYAQVETDRVKAGDAIEHALDLDPKNPEAHYLLGVRKNDPVQFEMATTFSPQNWIYWDALATAYLDQSRFADAMKAWRTAEQNAPDEATRARMEKKWRGMESSRLDFERTEKKRAEDDERAKIEKLKATALAQLHAVEAKTNGAPVEMTPVPWDEVMPYELKGTLTRVECLGTRTRISVAEANGKVTKLMVKKRKGLVCGAEPGIPVSLEYLKRPDEKLGTSGEIEIFSR